MSDVVLAIVDEPPFCWLDTDGAGAGSDVEVAATVVHGAGLGSLVVTKVTFAELIPGLMAGHWHLNTGMFVTPERRRQIRFTRPIWTASDGLIVRTAAADRISSYEDIAADPGARLGVVAQQVQGNAARQAGVPADRLVVFATLDEAVRAVRAGEIDAAASTAIGNRALVARRADARLATVDLRAGTAVGAFSFRPEPSALADAFDAALTYFLHSPEHRAIMRRHGFAEHELPPGPDPATSPHDRPSAGG
jgi:polar amino acid transport system substrate-binding protein